jgi:hypothetical protein
VVPVKGRESKVAVKKANHMRAATRKKWAKHFEKPDPQALVGCRWAAAILLRYCGETTWVRCARVDGNHTVVTLQYCRRCRFKEAK